MINDDTCATAEPPTGEAPRSWREDLIVRSLARVLARGKVTGRLALTLPSGRLETFGTSGPEAVIALRSFTPLWQGLTRGALGLASSYLDGELETPDLRAALRFCLANTTALAGLGGGILKPRWPDRLWHQRRGNTRAGSRRNIAAHYDLGNAFYRLWLDPSMTYSSALFDADHPGLAEAQANKNQAVIAALELQAGQRLLEIGCGWGGFAIAAARAGATVHGITLSREQLAYASTAIAAGGLSERAAVAFCDYRDVTGQFERIASIEMIEAVGEANWPIYFRTIAERLTAGGVAVIQGITIDERHFAAYRREPDFIQRYIFPGGMLPTVDIMRQQAERAGLGFETVTRFGSSYARTLAAWRDAFEAAWPQIAELGFDARFRRMWLYYLTYCEVGFETGDIDVGLYRLRKP